MKRHKVVAAFVVVAATSLALSACSTGSPSSTSTSSTKSNSNITIAYSSPDDGNGYHESFQCGIIAAAKKDGVKLSITGSNEYTPAAQIPVLNAVAATHPDAVITSATDATALQAPLQQLKSNGSKVVIYDDPNNQYGSIASAMVTANHYQGGEESAKELVKAIGTSGTVLVVDIAPGNPSTNARQKGFLAGVKKYSGIKILPVQYDANDRTKDASIVDATLAAHPDLTAIVGVYDGAGEGIMTALQAANKIGKVKVVTFDADPQLVDDVKAGSIVAIVNQAPFAQSQKAMQLAIEAAKGEKISPKVTEIPMPIVTKANVDTAAIQRELYVSKGCTQ
jgi:ribose transport system substrate-binding protein